MQLDLWLMLALTAAGAAAGFVDAIAGGGGLLSLPALLLAGLPPAEAIATNKLQGSFGAASATRTYLKAGLLDAPSLWIGVPAAALGAISGAVAVNLLEPRWLAVLVPLLLLGVALYVALAPRLSDQPRTARLGPAAVALAAVMPIGFYDGLFGPGAGSFYVLALAALGGRGLLAATAETKALNLTSNVVSLAVFIAGGQVAWTLGLPMALGQALGARLGARTAIAHGARIIRPLLALVSGAIALKLLLEPSNPLWGLLGRS